MNGDVWHEEIDEVLNGALGLGGSKITRGQAPRDLTYPPLVLGNV